ncbi:tannase/feruloyl esterase family alpha/beta hydrolase [Hydrogenophaga sp. BPS33]|uniref:tannase/feruloyl esterase family alpha/beta hydrolase n=1 Tax=Hydrogenophaga sp. BPS33 TaxID=2651974 RepID=UPI00135AA058|nr:tannase/feruloyl esterase family alpha/beta hydrolase [Hydrogenophaga sp. BPS33]
MKRSKLTWSALAVLAISGCGGGGSGDPVVSQPTEPIQLAPLAPNCEAIGDLVFDKTVFSSASRIADGAVSSGGVPMPEHCLIVGEINPRIGVNDVAYGIKFQLRLPLNWNGRFQFQGGGGVDGSVPNAYGTLRSSVMPALAQGSAVISSDMGHVGAGRDASFGLDPQARIDWGYNAVDKATQLGKAIVDRFYGNPAKYTYYVGCSGGGRQAMIASQRLPHLFDGVVAGAPILEQHAAQIGSMWGIQAFAAIAPLAADNKPILSQAFSTADQALIADGLLGACDGLDGAVDGLIENYQACRFNPAVLQCAGAKDATCLSADQVNALTKTMAGPRNSAGEQLYPGIPWETSIRGTTWRGNWLGTSATSTPNAARSTNQSIKYVFMTPPQPDFDYFQFNFDTDVALLTESAAITASTSTDYTVFKKKGGKAIIFTGNGDSLVNPAGVNRWYRNLVDDNGGLKATKEFAVFYNVPGMEHCSGGSALDVFDPVTPLYDWVEKGVKPPPMMATGSSFPGRTREICAYPLIARYKGFGDVNDPTSFRCEEGWP